jgi:hypothetical protein
LREEATGRKYGPGGNNGMPVRRLILLAGRRAGKDRFLSAVAVWRAALCTDWRKFQSVGEGAVCILLGADKRQASIPAKDEEGTHAPVQKGAEAEAESRHRYSGAGRDQTSPRDSEDWAKALDDARKQCQRRMLRKEIP